MAHVDRRERSPKFHCRRIVAVLTLSVIAIAGCAYKQAMQRGNSLMRQERYEDALAEYEKAQQIDPKAKKPAQKISQVKEKLLSVWTSEAKSALDEKNYLEAIELSGKLNAKMGDNADVQTFISTVVTDASSEADAAVQQRSYPKGVDIYDAIAVHLPPHGDVARDGSTRIRTTWAGHVDEDARKAEAAGHRGDAMLLWSKALQLTDSDERRTHRDALRQAIVDEWTYVVIPNGGRGPAGDIFGRLAAGAGPALIKVLPAGQSSRTWHARLKLKVNRPKFKTDRSRSQKTARYKSGTRQVENPSYKSRQDEVTRKEREVLRREEESNKQQQYVEKYTADVEREGPTPNVTTGAEQNLSNAKSRLEAARRGLETAKRDQQRARETLRGTQQFREEPVYADLQYTVTRHELTASLDLGGEIKHKDGRDSIEIKDGVSVTASDEAHPPQPVANLAENPLDLPAKPELANQLYVRVAQTVQTALDRSFEHHRNQLLARARAATVEGEKVDLYVTYILTNPARVPEDVITELGKLRNIEDVIGVVTGKQSAKDASGG